MGSSYVPMAQVFCNDWHMTNSQSASHASVMIAFRCENVRSFRHPLELSMLSTGLADRTAVREVVWRSGGRSLGVLPVAGLFGANASGKSNVLEAMDDMRALVLSSFRFGSPTGPIPRWPFRLDPDSIKAPSEYEIELILEGVRHQYGFQIDDHHVFAEWAYRWPRGRASLIFRRDGDEVELGAFEKGRGRAALGLLRPNALFLSTAASANHPLLLPLYEWFRRNLLLATTDTREARQSFTAKLLENEQAHASVLALLRAADIGITGVRQRPIDPQVRDRMELALRVLRGDEGDPGDLEHPSQIGDHDFQFTHRGSGSNVELEPQDESLGTLVWFGLVGPVLDSLAMGSVFLADELDASLHPSLVAQLIRLYQSPTTNPRRAQLIFNSHDTTILGDASGNRLIGRDQIWFTEKKNDGSTRLYPLSDLDPRKAEAVGRRYLSGRYGALPLLAPDEFDAAVEQFVGLEA